MNLSFPFFELQKLLQALTCVEMRGRSRRVEVAPAANESTRNDSRNIVSVRLKIVASED